MKEPTGNQDRALLSVIVPCRDEEQALPVFFRELTAVLTPMGIDYEVLFIDDGSRDGTLALLKEFSEKDKRVLYLSFSRNFGKEAAMLAGLSNARGDYVAVMDADMQDPPSMLPEMLDTLRTGEYDMVGTRRTDRTGEPVIRSAFARMFYRFMGRVSDADIVDGARDFRMMRREVADAVLSMGENSRFSKGLFGWVGFRTCWLPYKNVERVAGTSKWSFAALCKYAVDGIINFSQAPLSAGLWLGLLMAGGAFLAVLAILLRWLITGNLAGGWVFATCAVFLVGGIQLFCHGITARYIANICVETKRRPHYVIAETNGEHIKKVN